MRALVFDVKKQNWDRSQGFLAADVPVPTLGVGDSDAVVIKVRYAGVCGSDRGIWKREAFREQILGSLKADLSAGRQDAHVRILGHEFCGEIVAIGKSVKKGNKLSIGDFVSAESHVVCNRCFQCRNGQKNVCTNEKILGISHNGCFAEFIKVPAHIVWKTNAGKIRPEVAAIQEPFGNAVHAASKASLKGKTIAIFGLGPIGLFLTLIARGMGVKRIIGLTPHAASLAMAKRLGIDNAVRMRWPKPGEHTSDPQAIQEVLRITKGIGADVSFEMAGYNSSMNNAIQATRRGGDVVLFGLKNGNFVLQDYNKLIVRGVTLHAVIGRELWKTWETTRILLAHAKNGIQDNIYNVILKRGRGTILPFREYSNETFAEKLEEHPKILFKM